MTPIQCPFCSRPCSLTDTTCPKCGQSLDDEAKMEAVGDALRTEPTPLADSYDDLKPQTKKRKKQAAAFRDIRQPAQKSLDEATPDDLMMETVSTVVRTILLIIASLLALALFGWFAWWATG